jgi:predicted nucleotidyltransferase
MPIADTGCEITFEALCSIVAPIAEKRGVHRVYLIGSRARGDNDESSDFDFYIVPGQIQSLIGLSGLLRELKEALRCEVDVVCEDPHLKDDFIREVLRDRMLVYEA